MKMTVELLENIINTAQDCVFWKDKERRFVGVNQAFLDYYGFDSMDVLIGKTDEDMGWHSDPEPYKQDELSVLSGKSTYKVQGRCIIRGEERDIIASKRPLYDGDEIVGLVGSFSDISDVIRRKNSDGQVLYTIDALRKYSFFDRIIDEISLEEILDPLTGVLSRAYSVKFVRALMAENKPFTFTIIDLDNFKNYNDNFGHIAGDKVLTTVTKGLVDYTDGYGLVGRFGGDELLVIDLKNTETDDKVSFFENLYGNSNALRIKVYFENGASFVTATSGCASFPKDADNYSDLFALIDKMLYLGKNRGRNCYTIYEEDKHKDIEIHKIANNGIYTTLHSLKNKMDEENGFENKLSRIAPFLAESMNVNDLYYILSDNKMRSALDKEFDENVSDISNVMDDDLFCESSLDLIKRHSPEFYNALVKNGFESVLIGRIRKQDKIHGYLICAVTRSLRIWQENECAILYYLTEHLANEF